MLNREEAPVLPPTGMEATFYIRRAPPLFEPQATAKKRNWNAGAQVIANSQIPGTTAKQRQRQLAGNSRYEGVVVVGEAP